MITRDEILATHSRLAGERALWMARTGSRFLADARGVPPRIVAMQKAAIAGGTTQSGGTEALADLAAASEALVAAAAGFVGAFDGMRPDTMPGKFHTSYGTAITHPNASEVAEGSAVPVTMFATARKMLRERWVGGVIVASQDVLRHSNADALIEILMRQAIARGSDAVFVGAIATGAATVAASGVGPEAIAYDLRRALEAISTSGADSRFHIAIPLIVAKRLSQTTDAVGQLAFRVTPQGGILNGLRCHVSEALTTSALVVDARGLLTASGEVEIDVAKNASIEMATTPSNKVSDLASPPAPSETTLVSMFQTNAAAIRVRRQLDFTPLRSAIAAVITGVASSWGLTDTSPPA